MSAKAPPVPNDNQSHKGPGDPKGLRAESGSAKAGVPNNLSEQGQQGNIHQNTTHQGHQQDR